MRVWSLPDLKFYGKYVFCNMLLKSLSVDKKGKTKTKRMFSSWRDGDKRAFTARLYLVVVCALM